METLVLPLVTEYAPSLLIASLVLGFLLGSLYEVFRILRRAVTHSSLLVSFEDFFFFVFSALAYWIVCFSYSLGTLRWFSFFALGGGFLLYFLSLGRLMSAMSNAIIRAVVRTFVFFKKRLVFPLLRCLRVVALVLCAPVLRLLARLRARRKKARLQRMKRQFLKDMSADFL